VATADNKGVPLRRPADQLPAGARRKKGEKANKKQMAAKLIELQLAGGGVAADRVDPTEQSHGQRGGFAAKSLLLP
jgi:hypothetical protein